MKYRNRKVELNGIRFDSKKEARRYAELLSEERAGKIQDLRRQVKFVLIPSQRERSDGKKKGRVLERECAYIADFVYTRDGLCVVEDAKGYRTPEYKIKRKLMLFVHGIRIKET